MLDSSGEIPSALFPSPSLAQQTLWLQFEAGGDVYTDNGTWFVTPDDDQGQHMVFTNQNCEDLDGVLIARLTVMDPKNSASVFMGALFQGKDDAGVTWQQTAEIEFTYPSITDCNSNGVDDACDIANGTSNDDNGNGTPDECEFTDCNDNGVADEDDIDICMDMIKTCESNIVLFFVNYHQKQKLLFKRNIF